MSSIRLSRSVPRRGAAILVAGLATALGGCAPSVQVRTLDGAPAPVALHTFRIDDVAAPRTGGDPMLHNAIVDRVLRDDLRDDFAAKGYVEATMRDSVADFVVVVRDDEREVRRASTTTVGGPYVGLMPLYGGWYRRGWWGTEQVTRTWPVERGTVVVDVLDGRTRALRWRGEGSVDLTGDVTRDEARLAKAIAAVVARFPHAA